MSSRDFSEIVSLLLTQDTAGAFLALQDLRVSPPLSTNIDEETLSELEQALIRGGVPILDRLKVLRAAVDGLANRPDLHFSMASGSQRKYVIGVVRVNSFSVICSVLQEKAITFVNQVAEIVHGVVNRYLPADIKIFGGTILIMWQLLEGDVGTTRTPGDIPVFILSKLFAAVHCSPILASYRRHPGLQQHLGAQWRVTVSCGLHMGCVVKGAVGNELAMQVSYVSPSIHVANGIERVSQIYKVPVLISQAATEVCSRSLLAKCRHVDRVILEGCSSQIDLFSFDLHAGGLQVEEDISAQVVWNDESHRKAVDLLQQASAQAETGVGVADLVSAIDSEDPQITTMRMSYSVEFNQVFRMGFQNYLEGEWDIARRMLSMAKSMLGFEDGPCKALLQVMEKSEFKAPSDWSGCHSIQFDILSDGL